MADEDKRCAVGFSITLSSQLIAAGLAMLAVEGAYVSYALGARATTRAFVPLSLVAGLAFIVSIFVAGKAITQARNAGFDGGWTLEAGRSMFNWQATLLLVALVALAGSFLASGRSREVGLEAKVDTLRADIQRLEDQLTKLPDEHQRSRQQLEQQIQALTQELQAFRQQVLQLPNKPQSTETKRSKK
jgi:outer membrane murein-binding lipoprotein Lpp